MESEKSPIEVYFFPFFGGGHQIPMIDMSRLFASHGAKSTIIATSSNVHNFRNAIIREQLSGNAIAIHTLRLHDETSPPDADMSAPPLTDTSSLRAPLEALLSQSPPDCIVVDAFHCWAAEAIDCLGVKRIAFNGNGCFSRCVGECLRRFRPQDGVESDSQPFLVPGLPDRVELTRSQLPGRLVGVKSNKKAPDRMKDSEEKSFGVLVNSFHELEPSYAEFFWKEMRKKAWLVGPVSLCNRHVSDKVERGSKVSVDERRLIEWLDSKQPNSVLYVSFGSLARLSVQQLVEIAFALESSDRPFIWVIGKVSNPESDAATGDSLPAGFEERAQRGVIIRGWAPQLLILEHGSVGGFVTHCGWNSTLEGLSSGVAMATWPMSAEQFFNEKLVTEVLRVGVKVGSKEWASWNGERKAVVGREKVAAAVERLMGGGNEAAEMSRRAAAIGKMARSAVEEGGSSWKSLEALISDLHVCRRAEN